MVISLINLKGGVGKTTVAINLAAGIARKTNRLLMIDADPQGSALQWQAVENNIAFQIIHHPQPIEDQHATYLQQNYDHVVIDSPPANGALTDSILAISDLAIVPVNPSPLDIWASRAILKRIDVAQDYNQLLTTRLLICRKIPGTVVGRGARDALNVFEMAIFETELCQRIAYVEAMIAGVSVLQYAPSSKAAAEIQELCREVLPPTEHP
jgi:chromosome partitioning protein